MVAPAPGPPLHATAWPRPVAAERYDAVRDAYLDRVFATGQVRAAWQMGGVGAPGLPDLDLVLVVRGLPSAALDAALDIGALGEDARYVFMHRQFVLPEDLFPRHRDLFFGSDLRLVRGEAMDLDEPPAEVADVLRLCFHVEMMVRRLADFARLGSGGEVIAVRPLVAALHGVRFNVEHAAAWTDTADLQAYGADVAALRRAWFGLDRDAALGRLVPLLHRAGEVLATLLDRLAPAAAALCPGPPSRGVVRVLEIGETQRYGAGPTGATTAPNPLGRTVPRRLRERVKAHVAPLTRVAAPAGHFPFAALQAEALARRGARALARRVRGRIGGTPVPALAEAMRRRAAALADLMEFAGRSRLRHMAWLVPATWHRPYPWSYRLKACLLDLLGSRADPAEV